MQKAALGASEPTRRPAAWTRAVWTQARLPFHQHRLPDASAAGPTEGLLPDSEEVRPEQLPRPVESHSLPLRAANQSKYTPLLWQEPEEA